MSVIFALNLGGGKTKFVTEADDNIISIVKNITELKETGYISSIVSGMGGNITYPKRAVIGTDEGETLHAIPYDGSVVRPLGGEDIIYADGGYENIIYANDGEADVIYADDGAADVIYADEYDIIYADEYDVVYYTGEAPTVHGASEGHVIDLS